MSSLSCQISVIIFSTCSHYWLNCLHKGQSELLVESKCWRFEMRGNESLYFLIVFFQTFEVKTLYDNRRTEHRRTERSIYFLCLLGKKQTEERTSVQIAEANLFKHQFKSGSQSHLFQVFRRARDACLCLDSRAYYSYPNRKMEAIKRWDIFFFWIILSPRGKVCRSIMDVRPDLKWANFVELYGFSSLLAFSYSVSVGHIKLKHEIKLEP